MRMIKAIQIDPFECTVKQVEYDGSDFTKIYPLLSHETMPVDCFTAAYPRNFEGRDAVFVDDEGLLKSCDRFFKLDGYHEPLAGKGLIIGADDEGDSVSAATPISKLKVTFLAPVKIDGEVGLLKIGEFDGSKNGQADNEHETV